jgi:hypothetical protein
LKLTLALLLLLEFPCLLFTFLLQTFFLGTLFAVCLLGCELFLSDPLLLS